MDNPIRYNDLFDANISSGIDALIAKVNGVESSLVSMLKNVSDAAKALSGSLSMDSATKEGRDAIIKQAAEVEALRKQYEALETQLKAITNEKEKLNKVHPAKSTEAVDLGKAYQSLSVVLAEANINLESLLTTERQQQIAQKNGKVANEALSGSYNQLYAQYNLLKNVLNALSSEMRNNAKVGGVLEKQALDYMEKLKAMQEATGKHTLSVGDYTKAFNGLSISTQQVLRELPTLANSWSQFFIAISNNVPIFTDNLKRVAEETGSWKVAMKGVLTSVFSWQTALLGLLTILPKIAKAISDKKKATEEGNAATKKAIEMETLLKQIYIDIDKSVNQSISRLRALYGVAQDTTRSMEERLEVSKQLKGEYKDAFANYSAEEIALGKANSAYKALTATLIEHAKTKAYLDKITELESKAIELRPTVQSAKELKNETAELLDNTKARLANARASYAGEEVIQGLVSEMGAAQKKYDEANASFIKVDNALQEVDNDILGLTKDMNGFALSTDESTKKSTKELKDYYWEYRESSASAIGDEVKLIELSYQKKIYTLNSELEERKKNGTLTIEQEKYINGIINSLAIEATEKRNDAILKNYWETWNKVKDQFQEAVLGETIAEESISIFDKMREEIAKISVSMGESREKLNEAILSNSYKEAKEEGQIYKNLTIEKLKAEAELQKALLEMRLETDKSYSASQFSIDVAGIYAKLDKDIAGLSKKRKRINLADMIFGTTTGDGKGNVWKEIAPEAQLAIKGMETAWNSSISAMNEWMDKRIEMAEVAVEAAQKESEAAKTALDYEQEARANGYANNVEYARREYEEKLALEQKALAEKERLEKAQEAIDSAQQASSLITATANIIKGYSALPLIGQVLSIAAIAAMWGTFAAAKVTASQVTKYGEGMAEYLDYGGSHASGNDIDFGTDKRGRRRRVEKGEVIGVVNKKNVEKYGVDKVTGIIKSLNNGTFDSQYGFAQSLGLNGSLIDNQGVLDGRYGSAFEGFVGTDLSSVERGINTLVAQGNVRVVSTPYGRIEYRGNNKRIIRNS